MVVNNSREEGAYKMILRCAGDKEREWGGKFFGKERRAVG